MRFLAVLASAGSLLLLAISASAAVADGERDNNPLEVRRVPRAGVKVPAEKETALRAQLATLQAKIGELQKKKDPQTNTLLPDVMIFERAIRGALDYGEFFSPKDIGKADVVVAEGLSRAEQLLAGKPEWPNQSGLVVRGYTSRIDHTVQPYGLVVPKTYTFNHSVPTRCDVWFHGRGETLSELNFIWDRMKNAGRYTPDHTIVLHPYGRYSNAFKFAGETDVLEALADVQSRYRIDENRISVRGFSMGGAACWQFAVHYPSRWFAANPGAGFSETPKFLKFFQKETLTPKPWEQSLWKLYDCDKYAWNLTHCPTIAYSGEKDIQKQAADVMDAALAEHGIQLRHIIGSDMGHSIDEASQQIIEKAMSQLAISGRSRPASLQVFETHTLKYNQSGWITIDGLKEHWKPAYLVLDPRPPRPNDGRQTIAVQPDNVSAFTVNIPAGTIPVDVDVQKTANLLIRINVFDGENVQSTTIEGEGPFSDGSAIAKAHIDLSGKWVSGPRSSDKLLKRHNLQGPIDDAFMDSFVFVRPTGTTTNETVGKWADAELERAIVHWRRHFRGDARVVNDNEVTDEMIQSANLVLWGDPSSNSVMAKVAGKLPVKWTEKQIVVGDKTYDATTHAPILIYPNPLNPSRYIVFNSCFTYRDYAYLNNARQVPMLPDWAIIDLTTPPGNVWPGNVVTADFFDETWQLKP